MAKFYDKEINIDTNWNGDSTTGGMRVKGNRVQEFIRNTLKSLIDKTSSFSSQIQNKIDDAPQNGNTYCRNNGAWIPIKKPIMIMVDGTESAGFKVTQVVGTIPTTTLSVAAFQKFVSENTFLVFVRNYAAAPLSVTYRNNPRALIFSGTFITIDSDKSFYSIIIPSATIGTPVIIEPVGTLY